MNRRDPYVLNASAARPSPTMTPVLRPMLRVLRWAWLLPLGLALLLDLIVLMPKAATAQVVLVIAGLITSTVAIAWTVQLFPNPGTTRATNAHMWSLAAALLSLASTVLGAFVDDPLISLALLYALLVLVGVRLAHARRRRDVAVAALIGLATAVMPLAVPFDGLFIASLMTIGALISAVLGLVVANKGRASPKLSGGLPRTSVGRWRTSCTTRSLTKSRAFSYSRRRPALPQTQPCRPARRLAPSCS